MKVSSAKADRFSPTLFIGIGKDNHFFTLRETYLHEHTVGGRTEYEVRSFHHFNLSQDADEAIAKATAAAEHLGLPLNTSRTELVEQLNEIKRATAEELRQREEREAQWAAEREATQAAHLERWHEQIRNGYFPDCFRNCGNATGKWREYLLPNGFTTSVKERPFESADISYLNWLMDKNDAGEFEQGSLVAMTAARVAELCADKRLPKPDPKRHSGQVGTRSEFSVTVVRVFVYDGYYGPSHFVTMVTDDGCCLMSMGAFKPKVGERLRIKATIKKHDEYRGQAQTVVQRVATFQEQQAA